MANKDIRQVAKDKGIPHWLIADRIGISECTLSRWFRHELTGERLEQVQKAIQDILKARNQA